MISEKEGAEEHLREREAGEGGREGGGLKPCLVPPGVIRQVECRQCRKGGLAAYANRMRLPPLSLVSDAGEVTGVRGGDKSQL